MTLTLRQLRQFLPAVPIRAAGDFLLQGMSIDTRTLSPGNLYVALTGQKVDGHQYVEKAAELGAGAALVSHWVDGVEIPQIRFDDCEVGMGKIASVWRDLCNPTVIAVTGSNGKTTVKQMLGAIFSREFPGEETLITEGNLNNQQGVPLTLSKLSASTKVAIVEHGANHHDEIAYLATLSKPDIAIITNAGLAHLEGFGSVGGVAKAKGELVDGLSEQGVAILNADDDFFPEWLERVGKRKVISFGFTDESVVRVSHYGDAGFTLAYQEQTIHLSNNLSGKHNALNLAAAVAAAIAVGLPFVSSAEAALNYQPVKGRFALVDGFKAAHLINDSYNANPSSVIAGIKSLPENAVRWLALGEMRELGDASEQWHREVGLVAKAAGVERLFCFGDDMRFAADAFGDGAACYDSHELLVDDINHALVSAADKPWILVKGSLTTGMEKVIHLLEASAC